MQGRSTSDLHVPIWYVLIEELYKKQQLKSHCFNDEYFRSNPTRSFTQNCLSWNVVLIQRLKYHRYWLRTRIITQSRKVIRSSISEMRTHNKAEITWNIIEINLLHSCTYCSCSTLICLELLFFCHKTNDGVFIFSFFTCHVLNDICYSDWSVLTCEFSMNHNRPATTRKLFDLIVFQKYHWVSIILIDTSGLLMIPNPLYHTVRLSTKPNITEAHIFRLLRVTHKKNQLV